jgi:oligoendopeptidase F
MAEGKQGVTWDLTSFFPEFNGDEMLDFKKQLEADIAKLQEMAGELAPLKSTNAKQWEEVILLAEDFYARLGHIFSYVHCLKTAHTDREEYSQEEAKLMKLLAEYEKFAVDVMHGFKHATDKVFEAFTRRRKLKPIAHSLRRTREKAMHTMSPEEEKLAADLNVDGLRAWGRLYDKVSGKLEFEMNYPDGRQEMKPISQWRSLMSDVDREVGKAAFEGGNKAWQSIENVCAAALNGISGTRLTLNKHRGYDHYLDIALFQSQITRPTLDAMYQAIHENIEIGREIFRAKAKYMGRSGIYWFAREAPLPLEAAERYNWKQGVDMVNRAFSTVYPKLGKYYRSFLRKRWLESEVRPHKLPGAYCTGSEFTREQRVYMTFNGALGDVTTMAHEVGHAFHGHILKDMRPMAQQYPMTLAETASIFGEHILAEGIYDDDRISDAQKLLMLDGDLGGDAVLLLDITVRFEFEKALHDERANGELSVERLKELMLEKQREVFGDCMLEESADPMFWASKLHFYITGVTFYNFPYTFGFLIARALYNLFKQEGDSFLPRYEEFLKLSGSDTVENVVQRSIGGDTTDPAFWTKAIKSLEEPLKRYKKLLAK